MEEQQSIRMDEMNFRVILRDLLRNSLLIVMAVLTVLMGVRIYKKAVYVPEYTSTATMAILAKGATDGNAYTSLTTANSMAEVYAEVFQSSIIREKVDEVLGGMPAGTRIVSSLIPETNLLELQVRARDPQSAYRVMLVILDNYQYVSDYLFGNAVLEIIKDPEVPMGPSNHFNAARMDRLGCLLAVVLICGLVTLFSVLRGTVKTVKGAKRNLEGTCVAAIPYEKKNHTFIGRVLRRNKAILLNGQVVSFQYEESFHHLASSLDYEMEKAGQKVLLITSVAENEGKSTIAVNLAAALTERGRKVLVIDMDGQKPALYKLLEHPVQKSEQLVEYLKGNTDVQSLFQFDKKLGIYAVLSDQYMPDIQPYLDRPAFRQLLEEARKQFDYVIVDSSPVSVGADVEFLENYVDASVLVVHQDAVRISDLNDTIEMFREGKASFLGYVLNAFDTVAVSGGGYSGYYKYGPYGSYGSRAKEGKTEETEEKV